MKTSVFASLLLASFVSFAGFANDPPTTGGAVDAHHAAWMKHATPSEGHKRLNDLTGKWTYTMSWWNAPDTKAEVTKGTSTNKWVLGGRFLQSEVKGTAMGKPFEGLSFTGFDNTKGEYQSMWLDNMTTSMMNSAGTFADGMVKESGTMVDPMTGDKARWFRSELKFVNKKEHTYAMYTKTADGKEFKSMEITYIRK